ncbi:MAG: 50S ribosomal protein L1 [Candidatus Levybacteria bacterium GW2011_GWB1_41_21]|nr:MAG: 50S ribosomal protein L1 [Candidatus Levybacteria bacterium GW2011_GWB1_41_21]
MGKIRVKTIGEGAEEPKKKVKKEKGSEKTHLPGMGGGERVVMVGPTEEELAKIDLPPEEAKEGEEKEKSKQTGGKSKKASKKKERSKKYTAKIVKLDKNKQYSLKEALGILSKFEKAGFDETVELHINTLEGSVSGNMTLPHGTKTRVVEATDELIAEIEKGKISFDILVAKPEMMPKLAHVAKVLGPRGLMPNPKAGTITDKPEEIIKKFEGGQINFRSETKAPIVHLMVGKISLGPDKLSENINTAIKAVNKSKIRNVTLKSTMSPGIKIVV